MQSKKRMALFEQRNRVIANPRIEVVNWGLYEVEVQDASRVTPRVMIVVMHSVREQGMGRRLEVARMRPSLDLASRGPLQHPKQLADQRRNDPGRTSVD